MNRRGFLRSLFASTTTIVVAPAVALEALEEFVPTTRTYVDMGRHASVDRDASVLLLNGGEIKLLPGDPVTIRWERSPIVYTEHERVRTYASGGWHLVQLAPQRINHASRASEGSS